MVLSGARPCSYRVAVGFTTQIDWTLANLLLDASIAAYTAFDDDQPSTCNKVDIDDGYVDPGDLSAGDGRAVGRLSAQAPTPA